MIGSLTFTRELAVVLAAGLISAHDTFNILVLISTLWRSPRLGAGSLWARSGALLKIPASQTCSTAATAPAAARVREAGNILCRRGCAGSCARTQSRVADVAQDHGAAGARVPPGGRRGRHSRHAAREPKLQRGDFGGLTARPEEPRRRRTQHPGTHGEGVVRNNNGISSGGWWPPLTFSFPFTANSSFASVLAPAVSAVFTSHAVVYGDDLRRQTWQLCLHTVLTSHDTERSHTSTRVL
jgi:hypothetical protein